VIATPGPPQTASREPQADAAPQRPRRKAIWVIVAALTAFVVVVPFGAQMWGRLIRQTQQSRIMSGPHRITALQVDVGPGDVWITAGAAGEVTVDQTLKWALHKPRVESSWEGTTLRLRATCGTWKGMLLSSLQCSVGLRVRVPAPVALQATCTAGTVVANGLTGPTQLRTTSGVVTMRNLTGPVQAYAGSGVIEATDLRSSQVDAGLSSGTIRLTFTDAPQKVTARSSSGSVSIFVPPGQRYQVTGGSSSGEPFIERGLRDDGSDRRIDVHTASGAAEVRYTHT
jgi:hypothetical protein